MDERRAREVTLLEAFETAQPAGAELERRGPRLGRPRRARGGAAEARGRRVRRRARAGHALQRLGAARAGAARALGAAAVARGGWLGVVALIAFALGARRRRDRRRPAHQPARAAALGRAGLERRRLRRCCSRWPLVRAGAARAAARAGRSCARPSRCCACASACRARRRAAAPPRCAASPRCGCARSRAARALRAETALHAGAAALALGLVAGLYVRGLVLDYRAGWESTFLDAGDGARASSRPCSRPASR